MSDNNNHQIQANDGNERTDEEIERLLMQRDDLFDWVIAKKCSELKRKAEELEAKRTQNADQLRLAIRGH